MPINVSKEDWENAERFLEGKPSGTKFWRQCHLTLFGKQCNNSFIIINNVIYVMEREYINNSHYSNFKVKLCQDKNKKNYIMKIQNSAGAPESEYEKNELSIEDDLKLFIASGKRADCDKQIRIVTYSGVSLADYFEHNQQKLLPSEIITLFIHCAFKVSLLHEGLLSRSGKKYTCGDIKLESFTIDERSRISLTNLGFCRVLPNSGLATLRGFQELYLERDIYSLGRLLKGMIQAFSCLKDDDYIKSIINTMIKPQSVGVFSIHLICEKLNEWKNGYNLRRLTSAFQSSNPALFINQEKLLHGAIEAANNPEIFACLRMLDTDINQLNLSGYTPLMEMVRRGYIAHANVLISDGRIDFFKKNIEGKTVEYYAHQVGVAEQLSDLHKIAIIRTVARVLKSANPAKQIRQMNLLAVTAYYQCIDELVQCLNVTDDVNCTNSITGRYGEVDSLLFWALKYSHYQVVKLLSIKGVELNTLDPQKEFPIDYAIKKQDVKMVLILLYSGAQITEASKEYFFAEQSKVIAELEVFQRDISTADRLERIRMHDVIDFFVNLYREHAGVARSIRFFKFTPSLSNLAQKNEHMREALGLSMQL